MSPPEPPIGVVLAGGRGRRMGGKKAIVPLCGRPLISYPLRALQQVLDDVVIVAKAGTQLPDLPGVEVWREPDTPQHPLVGLTAALHRAGSRAVVVCGCDLPLLRAETVRRLAEDARTGNAALAWGAGRLQPLLGCYRPSARDHLSEQLRTHPDRSLQTIVSALAWVPVEVTCEELFNVNTPLELTRAAELLADRGTADSESSEDALE